MTWLFYLLVVLAPVMPLAFIWSIWKEGQSHEWNWINVQSLTMYVDAAKTLITASGIAVALVAASAISPTKNLDRAVISSAKVGVICLILCIFFSFAAILALMRGFERSSSRHRERGGSPTEGQLLLPELSFILIFGYFAIATFVEGLLFLGRIAFHL
jgi:hypothetical protein